MFKAEQDQIDILDLDFDPEGTKDREESELSEQEKLQNRIKSEEEITHLIHNVNNAPADVLRNTIASEKQYSVEKKRYIRKYDAAPTSGPKVDDIVVNNVKVLFDERMQREQDLLKGNIALRNKIGLGQTQIANVSIKL